jgi:hypothetical protein
MPIHVATTFGPVDACTDGTTQWPVTAVYVVPVSTSPDQFRKASSPSTTP